jgi:mRNA biogenesis factor
VREKMLRQEDGGFAALPLGHGVPERRPEESVYYHPTLNPQGLPPPGKAQRYKTMLSLSTGDGSSAVPLPKPPPLPKGPAPSRHLPPPPGAPPKPPGTRSHHFAAKPLHLFPLSTHALPLCQSFCLCPITNQPLASSGLVAESAPLPPPPGPPPGFSQHAAEQAEAGPGSSGAIPVLPPPPGPPPGMAGALLPPPSGPPPGMMPPPMGPPARMPPMPPGMMPPPPGMMPGFMFMPPPPGKPPGKFLAFGLFSRLPLA